MKFRYSMSILIHLALTAILILASCSSVRQIRPLAKKEQSVSATLGGPFTRELKWLPIPQLSLGYNRGIIDSALDIEAGLYATSAILGIMHVDAGLNWRPWLNDGALPGLIITPKVFLLTDFEPQSFRAFPVLCITTCWQVRQFWYIYAGLESWFEFHTERTDGNEQKYHWLPAPYIGVDAGKGKWQFALELRLYTPNIENTRRTMHNVGIGDYGAWGVMLGVKRTFGKK